MEILDLGDEKSNEKFSITPICDIFITVPLRTCDKVSMQIYTIMWNQSYISVNVGGPICRCGRTSL